MWLAIMAASRILVCLSLTCTEGATAELETRRTSIDAAYTSEGGECLERPRQFFDDSASLLQTTVGSSNLLTINSAPQNVSLMAGGALHRRFPCTPACLNEAPCPHCTVIGSLHGEDATGCRRPSVSYNVSETAKEWCTDAHNSRPPPTKLQGLFYLKGRKTGEKFACLSLGEWDAEELSLTLILTGPNSAFLWTRSDAADESAQLAFNNDAKLKIVFEDSTLTNGRVQSVNFFRIHFNFFGKLDFIQEYGDWSPGDVWSKPTYFFGLRTAISTAERVLNSNLTVNRQLNEDMLEHEGHSAEYIRYLCDPAESSAYAGDVFMLPHFLSG